MSANHKMLIRRVTDSLRRGDGFGGAAGAMGRDGLGSSAAAGAMTDGCGLDADGWSGDCPLRKALGKRD